MTDVPERRAGDVVAFQLDAIERRLDQQAKEQARGFADVRQQIAGLTFVRLDVYDADQRTAHQVHKELSKDIADGDAALASKIADGDAALASKIGDISTQMKLLWTVVGGAVIAGLIGVLFAYAGPT